MAKAKDKLEIYCYYGRKEEERKEAGGEEGERGQGCVSICMLKMSINAEQRRERGRRSASAEGPAGPAGTAFCCCPCSR